MSLDEAFQNAINAVPECVASGCVDMTTGMLLGAQTDDSHSQSVLDVVAAATSDLFQGTSIAEVQSMFSKVPDASSGSANNFQEIVIFSEKLIHVFLRSKNFPEHVVIFVCRTTANPGMVLAKTRMILDSVAGSV